MRKTVYYEAEDGVDTYSPHDVHTNNDPLATLLWYKEGSDGVAKKIHVPIHRIIRVVHNDIDN